MSNSPSELNPALTEEPSKLRFVDDAEQRELTWGLAEKILGKHERGSFDVIIPVARGGYTVGRFLSDYLGVDLMPAIGAESYKKDELDSQGEVRITQDLNVDIGGKKVLLVDELVQGGSTLKTVLELVEGEKPAEVVSAALFVKEVAAIKPDFYMESGVKEWLVFSYELYETLGALFEHWVDDEQYRDHLTGEFEQVGYGEEEIAVVFERIEAEKAREAEVAVV